MKKLFSILGNSQWLDGGAMFGNVPKAMWSKWVTPNEQNQIKLATRALLVQDGEKNILLETGIGAFFSPKMKQRFGVNENEHILLKSLGEIGIAHHDIDFVILSHLHFDHAGGLLSAWSEKNKYQLLFPNAKYLVSKLSWERANNPHPRDKASFIPELNKLLINSKRLITIDTQQLNELGEDYSFSYTNGHTPGLLHTTISMKDYSVIFCSDLIPGTPWIHLPITMGYDRSPELLIDEKKQFLEKCLKNNIKLFYTHDNSTCISNISIIDNKYIATNCIKSLTDPITL